MAKAAEREQQRIGCHRTRIIAAALEFVPRISAFPVIPLTDRFYDGQPFLYEAFVNHMAGGLVFEAVHALVRIRHGYLRTAPVRPCADEKAAFVVECVNAAGVGVVSQAIDKIVLIDCIHGLLHFAGIENIT